MAEIGATLREARLRAKIDIVEVEEATKIRAKYLRALENEEWGLLPGPAFVVIPAGLAISLVRETGPLTAGLLLSGRIGAGIGAELGAMRVTEQIDALEASAVDAFHYLVVTRVIACVIAVPILTTVMNFSGMLGGFLAETISTGMSIQLYFNRAFSLVDMTDYIPATMKTMVFGFIIATVSSYLGFTTESGTEGVGRASTRSVVLSSILIILSNVVLVRLIFFIFPKAAGE